MGSETAKMISSGVVVVAAGLFLWHQQSATTSSPITPNVIVNERVSDVVEFSPWQLDGVYLRSNMTLKSRHAAPPIDDIRFTAFDDHGVKLDEGPVEHPSVKEGETARASILITHQETRRVVVTAE